MEGVGRGCSWKSPGSRVKMALGMTPTPVTSWAILGEPVPTGSSPARWDLATRGQWDHWDSLRGTGGGCSEDGTKHDKHGNIVSVGADGACKSSWKHGGHRAPRLRPA